MELGEYQRRAGETNRIPGADDNRVVVPLLGMAGEVGSLLVEYKKLLRDGPSHRLFTEQVAEELGDILWYVSTLAAQFGLDLEAVAAQNLEKVRARWTPPDDSRSRRALDEAAPTSEQLPRDFVAELREERGQGGRGVRILFTVDGVNIGDQLTDNAWIDDGYRFHDAFHLAHAAVLGWSPVLRKLMRRKRRSDPRVDEVEDGGRAIVIEEAIVALSFDYAKDRDFMSYSDHIDYELLRAIQRLVVGRECSVRSAHEWEQAIVAGARAFSRVRAHGGGRFHADLEARTLEALD